METHHAGSLPFTPPDHLPSLVYPVPCLGRLTCETASICSLALWLPIGLHRQKHQQYIGGGEGREESVSFSLLVGFSQTGCHLHWLKIWVLHGGPFYATLSFRDNHVLSRPVSGNQTPVNSLRILPHPWWWRGHSFNWNYSHMTEPSVFFWNPDTPTLYRALC